MAPPAPASPAALGRGMSGRVPPPGAAAELVEFALESLPTLRRPSGLYCYDRAFGGEELRGESVRYSLMVLLGLQRAERAGMAVGVDVDGLSGLCLERLPTFTAGDVGLALWATGDGRASAVPELLAQARTLLATEEDLDRLVGMEVAWLAIGLSQWAHQPGAEETLSRVVAALRRRRALSGLYVHDGRSAGRSRFPNFATEIYTVLALASLARAGLDEHAKEHAEVLANLLVRFQDPDGGWPWLYDAERAEVVERYEVYSVHQDAMAPMAMLELSALTGDDSYAAAAVRGLAWSRGNNELTFDLIDRDARFAHRSIRRKRPWDRAVLAANVAGTRFVGRPLHRSGSFLEVNRTCRPYHLGWMLEAWAGRADLAEVRPDA
jgi:hypothetical protein